VLTVQREGVILNSHKGMACLGTLPVSTLLSSFFGLSAAS
jgi:hypothetical protein